MEQTPLNEAPQVEKDAFDRYWSGVLFNKGVNTVVINPQIATPLIYSATAPIGYENLMTLTSSENIARIAIRYLYGRPAHVYIVGFDDRVPGSEEQYRALPENPAATELLARNGHNLAVRGNAVIVTADAIDIRDLQSDLVIADAATMPELERDHIHAVGGTAAAHWNMITRTVGEGLIPSMTQTAPSLDRIAWLVKALIVGLDLDIVTYAALHEAFAKNPMLKQVYAGLFQLQAAYFSGTLQDMSEEGSMEAAPKAVTPAGFSPRYQQVVH